jgi:branched-chain amino acid transport system ATP-binding protein
MTLLEVESLDQFYRDFQALFGITLTVDEGEIVAIIGANGAGKSTFMKTVVGLLRSEPERVRFEGQSVGARPAYARVTSGISLVPEGRRVFPTLSVEENLMVGAWGKRKGPWNLRRVYEVFPHLAGLTSASSSVLSGGEQQAVAIGRALMGNPRLLLLDEISLGLAPIVVKRLYETVPVIAGEGTTMVIVEQDVSQALRIADRAYCFLEGRISLQGRPEDLTRDQITTAYFGM